MPDDPNNRGPKDGSRINVNQPHEVAYWTNALGCTAQELRDAVEAVGVMADKVREYLRNKKKSISSPSPGVSRQPSRAAGPERASVSRGLEEG